MESNEKLEQLLKQMYAQESLHDDIDTSGIVDEEWTKFEAKHFGGKKQEARSKRFGFLKIAAMFICVLMLGGIAYATIHYMTSSSPSTQEQATAVDNSQFSILNSQFSESDSQALTPVVYEDTELNTILNDIATFYQVECVYKNKDVKHVRLYFTWDKQLTIDELIDMFNKFERFHITRDNQRLIVE